MPGRRWHVPALTHGVLCWPYRSRTGCASSRGCSFGNLHRPNFGCADSLRRFRAHGLNYSSPPRSGKSPASRPHRCGRHESSQKQDGRFSRTSGHLERRQERLQRSPGHGVVAHLIGNSHVGMTVCYAAFHRPHPAWGFDAGLARTWGHRAVRATISWKLLVHAPEVVAWKPGGPLHPAASCHIRTGLGFRTAPIPGRFEPGKEQALGYRRKGFYKLITNGVSVRQLRGFRIRPRLHTVPVAGSDIRPTHSDSHVGIKAACRAAEAGPRVHSQRITFRHNR